MLFYGTTTNKCEKYSLTDVCWEEIEEIETPQGDATAAIIDDTIYIMGKVSCFVLNYHTNQVEPQNYNFNGVLDFFHPIVVKH